jgi:uncharacterized RDD family membrane protein YckC
MAQSLTGTRGSGRLLAAIVDHWVAIVLFFLVAIPMADYAGDIAAGVFSVVAYLGYFFLTEWLLGYTPGKRFLGLRVRQLSGERCTAWQIAVRTATRFLEVNPLLCGAIPAALIVVYTKRRQRLGDLIAGTAVMRLEDLERRPSTVKVVSDIDVPVIK